MSGKILNFTDSTKKQTLVLPAVFKKFIVTIIWDSKSQIRYFQMLRDILGCETLLETANIFISLTTPSQYIKSRIIGKMSSFQPFFTHSLCSSYYLKRTGSIKIVKLE